MPLASFAGVFRPHGVEDRPCLPSRPCFDHAARGGEVVEAVQVAKWDEVKREHTNRRTHGMEASIAPPFLERNVVFQGAIPPTSMLPECT